MTNEDPILGYDRDGNPIHETKRGCVYTAACILCQECRAFIRGMGGPRYGSICVKCHDKKAAHDIKESE
jgi:hypothetical protein